MSDCTPQSPLLELKNLGAGNNATMILLLMSTSTYIILFAGVWLSYDVIIQKCRVAFGVSISHQSIFYRNTSLIFWLISLICSLICIYKTRINDFVKAKHNEKDGCFDSIKNWAEAQFGAWSNQRDTPSLGRHIKIATACYSTLNRNGNPTVILGSSIASRPTHELRFLLAHEFSHCETEFCTNSLTYIGTKGIPNDHLAGTLVYISVTISTFSALGFFTLFFFMPIPSLISFGGLILVFSIFPLFAIVALAHSLLIKSEFLHDLRAAQLVEDKSIGIKMLEERKRQSSGIWLLYEEILELCFKFHPTSSARISRLKSGNFLSFDTIFTPFACGLIFLLLNLNNGALIFLLENLISPLEIVATCGIIFSTMIVYCIRSHCIVIAVETSQRIKYGKSSEAVISLFARALVYCFFLLLGFLMPFFISIVTPMRESTLACIRVSESTATSPTLLFTVVIPVSLICLSSFIVSSVLIIMLRIERSLKSHFHIVETIFMVLIFLPTVGLIAMNPEDTKFLYVIAVCMYDIILVLLWWLLIAIFGNQAADKAIDWQV